MQRTLTPLLARRAAVGVNSILQTFGSEFSGCQLRLSAKIVTLFPLEFLLNDLDLCSAPGDTTNFHELKTVFVNATWRPYRFEQRWTTDFDILEADMQTADAFLAGLGIAELIGCKFRC